MLVSAWEEVRCQRKQPNACLSRQGPLLHMENIAYLISHIIEQHELYCSVGASSGPGFFLPFVFVGFYAGGGGADFCGLIWRFVSLPSGYYIDFSFEIDSYIGEDITTGGGAATIGAGGIGAAIISSCILSKN